MKVTLADVVILGMAAIVLGFGIVVSTAPHRRPVPLRDWFPATAAPSSPATVPPALEADQAAAEPQGPATPHGHHW